MSAERGRFPQPTPIDKTRFLPPRDLPQAVRPLPHGTTPLTDSQLPKMAELRRRSVGDVLRQQVKLMTIIPLALAASRLATTDGQDAKPELKRRFISADALLKKLSREEIEDGLPERYRTDGGNLDFTDAVEERVDAELAAKKARGGKGIGRPPLGPKV